MIKSIGFISIAVAATAIFTPNQASAEAIPCGYCERSFEFKQAAQNFGGGDHLVYNLHSNKIERWIIPQGNPPTNPFNDQPGAGILAADGATKGSVPQGARNELQSGHEVVVLGNGTLSPRFQVNAGDFGIPGGDKTAYDVIRNDNLKTQISDAVADFETIDAITGHDFATAYMDLKGLATTYLGLRQQLKLLIKVKMSDGSYFYVEVSEAHPFGEFIDGSARTEGGQLIPETIDQVQGTWEGGATSGDMSMGGMAGHMAALGAEISYSGSGSTLVGISCGAGVCVVTMIE